LQYYSFNPFPRFHFDSIADDNDARSKSIEQIIPPLIPSTREHPVPILLKGTQCIQKSNCPTEDDVLIYVALFRLDKYNVDIVLSCNIPVRTGSPDTKTAGDQLEEVEKITAAFDHTVNSFKIVDYSLFVDGSEN